ncbi:MAG: endonuclease V [Elusimicrobiota bacterium]|nr:endonuclease V [Elusimicrobiota bacterium]
MIPVINHPWNVSLEEAKKIQFELQSKINLCDVYKSLNEIKTVAGCDVSFDDDKIVAAIVVMKFPELKILASFSHIPLPPLFPYIPTYLAFREGPLIVELLSKLKDLMPDVMIFDGQGIAHPRKMGIATHIGILFDTVTIGCAKNLLYGNYEEPPPGIKGAYTYLKDDSGDMIGISLRTKKNVKPVFVSPGHKISIDFSGDVILACCRKYRLPEPIRLAHQLTKYPDE